MVRKSRKILSGILVVLMLVTMLSACSSGGDNHEGGTSPQSAGSDSVENSGNDGQAADGVMNFDEDPYEVLIQIVTFGADYADIPAIEEAINEITLPAINCTVKILNHSITDFAQKASMMVAGGEKIDLIMAGLTTSISAMASDGMVEELDELLVERGQGILELFGDMIDGGRVNGNIYAVPADAYPAAAGGIVYLKETAEKYGITFSDMTNYDELEAAFEKLADSGDDIYGTARGDGKITVSTYHYSVNTMGDGSRLAHGVIVNPEESTEVVNWYDTDEFKEYIAKTREWYEKGYIVPDTMTAGLSVQDIMKSGRAFLTPTNYDPSQEQVWSSTMGGDVELKQLTEAMLGTENVQETMWAVPITSERPEKAVDFLNLLYTNADVANLLSNGVEDLTYKKVSDNIITHADGVDTDNPGYQRIFSRFGDKMTTYQWEPSTEDFFTNLASFSENAVISKTLGYTFNSDDVMAEVAAVSNVVEEHLPSLECGVLEDYEKALDDFNEALKKAGLDKIIEENQRQLDEWLAAQ